jgi:hypothetical protein
MTACHHYLDQTSASLTGYFGIRGLGLASSAFFPAFPMPASLIY